MTHLDEKALWCVNITGPDDVIAVATYIEAVQAANRFNEWWQSQRKAIPLNEAMDARMWASPAEWPGSSLSHAESIYSPSDEYAWLLSSLPSSPVSELVDLRECLVRFVKAFPAAADYPLIKRGYAALSTLSTRNAELEREVKRLRRAAGNAYRACMSAWACGEPPHRVKTMIEEVERLGVVIGEAGAAALSSAAVAEREPVAVVVGHHAESGNRIEWLRDLAPGRFKTLPRSPIHLRARGRERKAAGSERKPKGRYHHFAQTSV